MPEPISVESAPEPDGRRRRSNRSRERIVQALLDLVRDGEYEPSAAQVADAAGISLRSVFRHFEEVDQIYVEMSRVMEAKVQPLMDSPIKGDTLLDRLNALADRRADIFELIMPFRICATTRRFRSAYLQANHERVIRLERNNVQAILSETGAPDMSQLAALDVILSFETWHRLRKEQGLSKSTALETVRYLVGSVVQSDTR